MGDDTHHNGVLFLRDAFSFIGGSFGRPMDNPTTEAAAAPRYVRTDEYDFFLRKATSTTSATYRPASGTDDASSITTTGGANAEVRAMHDLRPAILVVGRPVRCRGCYGAWTTRAPDPAPEPGHVVLDDGRRPVGAVAGGRRTAATRLGKIRFEVTSR